MNWIDQIIKTRSCRISSFWVNQRITRILNHTMECFGMSVCRRAGSLICTRRGRK